MSFLVQRRTTAVQLPGFAILVSLVTSTVHWLFVLFLPVPTVFVQCPDKVTSLVFDCIELVTFQIVITAVYPLRVNTPTVANKKVDDLDVVELVPIYLVADLTKYPSSS